MYKSVFLSFILGLFVIPLSLGQSKQEQLFIALDSLDFPKVERLVGEGASLSTPDANGTLPLHHLVYRGNTEGIELLLRLGADVNQIAPTTQNALSSAFGMKNKEVFDLLLSKGANINYDPGMGMTLLMSAEALVFSNKEEAFDWIRYLVERGADINARHPTLGSTLQMAFNYQNQELITLLIELGADINAEDPFYGTLLHNAVYSGKMNIAELLLEKGMDPNLRNKEGQTPLMQAISLNKPGYCQLLLEKGASTEMEDNAGKSVQSYADDCYNEEIKKLIANPESASSKDAQVSKQNDRLVSAVQMGNMEEFEQALLQGADVNHEHPTMKWTPLHWAAQLMRTEMAKKLIKKGADPNHLDYQSNTPLVIAAPTGNTALVDYLLKKGAKINHQNNEGVTALMEAMHRGKIDVCRLLLKNGADKSLKDIHGDDGRARTIKVVYGYDIRAIAWWDHPEEYNDNLLWITKNVFLNPINVNQPFKKAAKSRLAEQDQLIAGATDEEERFTLISEINDIYYFLGDFETQKKFLDAKIVQYPEEVGPKILRAHYDVNMGNMKDARNLLSSIQGKASRAPSSIRLLYDGLEAYYLAATGSRKTTRELIPTSLRAELQSKGENYMSHRIYFDMYREVARFARFAGDFAWLEEYRVNMSATQVDDPWALKFLLPYYNGHNIYTINQEVNVLNTKAYNLNVILLSVAHFSRVLDNNHPEMLGMMVEMAGVLADRGEFAAVDLIYTEVEKKYEKVYGRSSSKFARIWLEHSMLYKKMGNYDKAQKMLIEALTVFSGEFGESHPEYAASLRQLGAYHRMLKEYDQATYFLEKSIDLYERTVGLINMDGCLALNELGIVKFLTGDLVSARSYFEKAESNFKTFSKNDFYTYSQFEGNLGMVNQAQGNFKSALQQYNRAQGISSSNGQDYYYRKYGLLGAKLYHQLNQELMTRQKTLEVLASHQESIQNAFPTLSASEKENYYKALMSEMKFINAVLMQQQPKHQEMADTLFNSVLQMKALILSSQIAVREQIANSTNNELKYDFEKWLSIRDEIARLKPMVTEGDPLEAELDSLENRSERLEKALTLRSLEFSEAYDTKPPVWQDIQSQLKPGEIAIEMIRGEIEEVPYYGALILKAGRSEHPTLVMIPEGFNLENRNFKYHRNTIQGKYEDELSFNAYWQPIHEAIKGAKRVYFSPDGVYNQLNLNVLQDPVSKNYILDLYEIVQLTTTRELLTEKSPQKLIRNAALFGRPTFELNTTSEEDAIENAFEKYEVERYRGYLRGSEFADLPGTEGELKAIEAILKKKKVDVQAYLGKDAKEAHIKSVQSPQVVHLATHGFFISERDTEEGDTTLALRLIGEEFSRDKGSDPMLRSGILLAGVSNFLKNGLLIDKEDGILTAFEALKLDLAETEIVILSACETGLGEIRDGQGVYGLQRSLKVAGASSIMMSLWKVSDEATKHLMTHFYDEWVRTGDKRKAFRNAQRALREDFPEPQYWGAFVLVGN